MKRIILAAATAIFLALPLAAQTQPNEQPSLGDAARKVREQKKTPAKPAKVITNDNIGSSPVAATPAAETEAPAEAKTSQAKPSKPGAKGEETPEKQRAKEEAEWRKRFAEAHTKLEQAEKELDILQRELNLLQQQYYSDPNKALQQQYSRGDIDAHRQKIDDKQKEVEQLRRALSDLEDELRRSGGDPGWARE